MPKPVFYSFHYDRDVHRVQLVKNIGALEGQPLLNSQEWEKVRSGGDAAIQKWINEKMAYKKAAIVLIGKDTAGRPWSSTRWKRRGPTSGPSSASGFTVCRRLGA